MRRRLSFLIVTSLLVLSGTATSRVQPLGASDLNQPVLAPAFAFAEPGISPDGTEIAFASGGDIWSVPTAGGDARLLVSHDATERRPLYSPDGRHLAFMSTRTGGGDLYLLTFATADVRRLTFDDGIETLESWSADGTWVYFSSTRGDIAGMNDLFRVSAGGGTPMAVSEDRYVNEFGAAPSPDGRSLVFVARGIASSQWWRRGSSHLDQSELWMMSLEGAPEYRAIGTKDARQMWPMWSADGRSVFYVSDRGGAENVWVRPVAGEGAGRRVTSFATGRVLWPSMSAGGKTIAFERDFGIWTLEVGGGAPRVIPVTRRGASSTPVPERTRQTAGFTDLALSPDGRKVAFVARGAVFAASAKDGGDATRILTTAGLASQPAWSPDSRGIAYVAAREGVQRLYLYDFASGRETALTSSAGLDLSPVFSPDGKGVVFLRDRRELRLITLETKVERVLATGTFADALDSPKPVWSPDGRWVAVLAIGAKSFTNVQLVPTGAPGGPPRPVSFLANVYANTIAWAPDGTYLLFDTRQRTEPGQLARVDLTLRTPKFREDLFRDLFSSNPRTPEPPNQTANLAAPEPGNPVANPGTREPLFDGIRQRLSLLPVGLDVQEVAISPDGKTAVVAATAAGQTNLYAYSLDDLSAERPVARQLTTTPGGKADPQFTPDNREVYYLENGRINIATVDRRESRALTVTAEFTTDFATEKLEVFRQAWTLLRDNFFDPKFNGITWDASREQYGPRVAASSTPDEMRRVISLMMGDLNASHLGISGGISGGAAATPVVGRLGLRFDRREYESAGRLRIVDVVPLGPADVSQGVRTGEYLRAVDGRPTGAGISLDERLAHTIDRRVVVSVSATPEGPIREVAVKPINQATEKSLLYRQWVESNRQYVLKVSGGRLGYVHMINMSAAALDQLHIDLDTENHERDGVVIDLRNNNGGFVNAYAIDVFARQSYLRMSLRGLPESPARSVLGQRALELPTVLVTNQHSLSDAEDFTEGYRTLKLGPIVGEPTAGWIIYTWDQRLVDGSTLRLPRMRVRASDGSDMENHPRKVDVTVSRPIGEGLTGKDSQLDEAIRTLLRRLGFAE